MKVWATAVTTLAILTGLAVGAVMTPVAKGQTKLEWSEPSVFQLITGRGRLGVSVRDVGADDAKQSKVPTAGGVLIEEVREDSPASKAGFKVGDLVVEFDGERVRSTRQFTRLVQETPTGRQVQAIVLRDGQRTTLSVQVEDADSYTYWSDSAPNAFRMLPPKPPRPPEPPEAFPRLERFFYSQGRLGVTVDSLSDQLADYFGTKDGVLVTSVTTNSAAAKAGLKAGDVITGINGSVVDAPGDISRITRSLEDAVEFTVEIVRDRKPMTLKGKIEAPRPRNWTRRSII